jgi:hypothetical protein
MINPGFSLLSLMRKPPLRSALHVIGWVICGGLIGSIPTSGYTSQSNTAEQAAALKTCSLQLTPSDNRYLGRVIQTQLASLYQNNSDFQAQLKNGRLLNDGIVGPATRYWLDYFCDEFAFTTPQTSTNQHQVFIESLLIELSRAAQLNALFPTWRTAIKPAELLHLTSPAIVQKLASGAANGNRGTAAPTPAPQIPDSSTAPYYYQLTEENIASLTQRQSLLDTLTKLEKQQFEQRSQLYNQLSDLFTQLQKPDAPLPNIDSLIDSYSIEDSHSSSSATTSTSTSTSTSQSANSAGTDTSTANQSPDDKTPAIPDTSTQVIETSTQSDTQMTAPQIVWQLNAEALHDMLKQMGITALSKKQLKALAPLQNEVFPSLYLLKMAVNESGIPPEEMQDKGVFALARKDGLSPRHAVPMQWDAPPDCGCQDSTKSVFNVGSFYGFYPYWQHLAKGQTIDFSRLDRVGYIAAVMKPEGSGNTLALPQNWLAGQKFSQFIQTTHRYRTKLDLVVTTPGDLSRDQLTALFTDDMVKNLVDAVTAPMDNYLINSLKPVISFGFEDVPSMADGITFDIDLSILNTQESQQALFTFLDKLKIALRQSYKRQAVASDLDYPISSSDKYYLNVVVPIKDVVNSKDNFYSFNNLNTLSQSTNLLIAQPGSPVVNDKADDELAQIKQLQQWLSNQENQLAVQQVYKRLVPVLITEDNREASTLPQLVNLSSWSFLGAAYWPLPLSETNETLIDKTFFPEATQYPPPLNRVINGATSQLNWICIYRWEIRTGLFVSFIFIFVFLAVCIWSFPLRKYLSRVPFVALASLSICGLMLVFVADPLFKDYQGPILLVFMVAIGWILFAVRMVRKEGDKP